MNDKVTISLFQLAQMFPDQESARAYLEGRRWADGVVCPLCGSCERITARKGGYYRCNVCKEDFTVRTNTIFERSHVPLHKWLYAMYMLMTARKGISSMQLSKEIGVTQKTAWFMLQRIREACGNDPEKLSGIVEVDETYVGGKEGNKHASKKVPGRGTVGKTPVIGMRERGGRVKGVAIAKADIASISEVISSNIEPGTEIHTDEHSAYTKLESLSYKHESINHGAKEYKRGDVTTNGIESVFAVLKRGLIGVYHHASEKHLGRYVDEFSFRLNDGNVKRHTVARLNSLIKATEGRGITYKELISQ